MWCQGKAVKVARGAVGRHETAWRPVLEGMGGTDGIDGSVKHGGDSMKIVVIGGTGLIGSKLVTRLREQGHQPVAASPDTGVNTLTGDGLADVLKGASVVVDVANSPSFEDAAVLTFFQTSTSNLLTQEAAAGVGHHVALSVVGAERVAARGSGYMRAKVVQERLIKESGIPYSIVQATQFFEFVGRIADAATVGTTVRLPPVLFQPMAAEDVARAVGKVVVGKPLNGTVEVAGPERARFDEFIRRDLEARKDPRQVVADPQARYFGAELDETALVPGEGALFGETRFDDWISEPTAPPAGQVGGDAGGPSASAVSQSVTSARRRAGSVTRN